MTVQFKPATKTASRLRLALAGPAGSGKTYSSLAIACALSQRVAVLDTERGSASKYSDLFEFSTLELESFHPDRYIEAIEAAADAGFEALVIDSLSHAWMGKDGALELVDRAAKRSQSANSFGAWREVTPLHNALVDAMIGSRLHLIVTLRSKTEYVQEKDEKGRTVIRKMGMAPVQRDGLEYEFDVYGDLDQDNSLIIGKTRCPALAGQIIRKPGAQIAATLQEWLGGAPVFVPTRERDVKDKVAPVVAPSPLRERSRDELIDRYATLVAEAHEKSLELDEKEWSLAHDSTPQEVRRKGVALRNLIDQSVAAAAGRTA